MPTNSGAAVPRYTRSSSLAAGRSSSGSLRDEDEDDDDYDDEGGGRLSELYPRYASRFEKRKESKFRRLSFRLSLLENNNNNNEKTLQKPLLRQQPRQAE